MNIPKKYSIKNIVLLAISLVLTIAICSAASYAWFLEQSTASANISAKVLAFYFTTNGKFNQDVTVSSEGYNITYDNTNLDGMFPGQTFNAPIVFSNQQSNVDAKYTVTVVSSNAPDDFVWKLRNKDDNSTVDITSQVNGKQVIITKTIGKVSNSFDIVGNWPKGGTDTNEKNAKDIAFMETKKPIEIKLRVVAEQVV